MLLHKQSWTKIWSNSSLKEQEKRRVTVSYVAKDTHHVDSAVRLINDFTSDLGSAFSCEQTWPLMSRITQLTVPGSVRFQKKYGWRQNPFLGGLEWCCLKLCFRCKLCKVINCLKWCHLSQCWLGLETEKLKIEILVEKEASLFLFFSS